MTPLTGIAVGSIVVGAGGGNQTTGVSLSASPIVVGTASLLPTSPIPGLSASPSPGSEPGLSVIPGQSLSNSPQQIPPILSNSGIPAGVSASPSSAPVLAQDSTGSGCNLQSWISAFF